MTFFVVIFICLIVALLMLAPLLWKFSRENRSLQSCLKETQHDVAKTLRLSEYYRMASENASDGLIIQDMQGKIVWCNLAYCKLHKRPAEDMLGRNPLSFCLPPDEAMSEAEIAELSFDIYENKINLCRNRNGEDELFWNQINVSFRKSADGRDYAVVVCRDVTEQVERQNEMREIGVRLEHEATHDAMTGLPNRAAFLAFFDNALKVSDRRSIGLLHIDLDNFKNINDTHGHSAGDAVLSRTATTIRENVRTNDLVARVGGDEFVVVCPDSPDLSYLERASNRLLDAISEPFEWSNRILQIEASIGAAISLDDPITAEDLLVQADFALYDAKREGRHRAILYDKAMHHRHAAQIVRSNELVEVIDTGALDYFFQPTLDLKTGQIVGFETLVRWIHPIDGVIPPDDFLPMVKDLGLMGALDLWSMTAALTEKRRLNDGGFDTIGVAFNASPELLGHPDFINRLTWGVEAGNIDRAQITIEVLETTEFGEASETSSHAATIRDLHTAGFQVHLDDFGVGFAGLSHLATLDVTGVKIDRSLVFDLLTDDTNEKIVRKIVELSNDLGLTVIAEGVEDLQTAHALEAMGCGIIQGYWLSKPMPADVLYGWLADRDRAHNSLRA